jgi:hypothetical protein
MDGVGDYTYCNGPKVAKSEVTRGDIACLCRELVASFGPNYTFVPEANLRRRYKDAEVAR